ncbi:BMP-binding endothelial regulator protein-like [Limulus polyphemus]|uniref:BMP-binding endothelial regulator protein-like n=1 Tax=Limulus polyphemus TaxID=6850 RepID=A0ABM1BLN3_LIMPO|nr:BMP-binding endothelial regulator protein-like [Limulus polyphemus]
MATNSTITGLLARLVLATFLTFLSTPNLSKGLIHGGSPISCHNEGEEVVLPLIAKSPCIKCECKNGHVNCRRTACSSDKECYFLPYNEKRGCCNLCKGCHLNGKLHESETEWIDNNDPCQTYSCQSGILTEARLHCHVPCRNPQPPTPGECCPSCKGCSIGGRTYRDGEELEATKADACVQCRCQKGNVVCFKKACPVLPCQSIRYVHRPGDCCPRCRGSRKIEDVSGKCHLATNTISNGEKVTFDPCTHCKCQNSTTICKRKVCPPVHCPPQFQVALPDQCCYKCREPEERKPVCMFEGRAYEEGETWKRDSCVQCSCIESQVMCSVVDCSVNRCPTGYKLKSMPGICCPSCVEDDGVCTVFGDPHYRTFDSRIFTFQGPCKYVLAKDCNGNKTFSIRVINNQRHSKTVSWTQKLRIKIGGVKVILGQFLKVKVNKKKVRLPFVKLGVLSVLQEGYMVVVRTNIGLKVTWDGDSYVEVSLPPDFKNQMCGLCGNYNGDPDDDFTTKKGNRVTDVVTFGNVWKRGKKRQCKMLQPEPVSKGICGQNWEARIRGIEECSVLKSTLFRRCFQVVDLGPYLRSCLMDVCECSDSRKCYCQAVQAYARECERQKANIDLNWRALTGCENSHCPKGAVFTACGPPCKKTCRNYKRKKPCTRRCRPGCQCPEGTVFNKKQCMPIEKCYS